MEQLLPITSEYEERLRRCEYVPRFPFGRRMLRDDVQYSSSLGLGLIGVIFLITYHLSIILSLPNAIAQVTVVCFYVTSVTLPITRTDITRSRINISLAAILEHRFCSSAFSFYRGFTRVRLITKFHSRSSVTSCK